MKKKLIVTLTLIASVMMALGTRLPSKSFPLSELEQAKALAKEKNKPLIFIDT